MRRFPSVFALIALLSMAPPARAHPTIENAMEVVVAADRVSLRAKISMPEIDIANTIDQSGSGPIDPAKIKASVDAHGPYLLSHLRVSADGAALAGKLLKSTPPAGEVTWVTIEEHEAVYEIEYALPKPRPKTVRIEQDVLKEFSRLGQSWTVVFVVQSRQENQRESTEHLLTREEPTEIDCSWRDIATTESATGPALAEAGDHSRGQTMTSLRVARQFLVHGFHHILTGYDHLLFVAALVIGATRLSDLVKVVTAFAIAHTLTLTLSVLDLVRLPSSIVEPIIAASIVFVALQNVLFPRQSRGNARLAIAFGFGLFHGLGFAGGLLEAMEGMPAISLAVALLSFTLGVELAHQVLIVPLFVLLKPLRRSARADAGSISPTLVMPLRLASLLISVAGVFYLVNALRGT